MNESGEGTCHASFSEGQVVESQNLFQGLTDLLKDRRVQIDQRSPCEPVVVDGPELVDQQVRILFKPFLGADADTQGEGIVDDVRGEGDNEGGRMVDIEEGLVLNDENRSGLSRLGAMTRVQVSQPDLPLVRHGVLSRWSQIPR